jgi:hypothetical protein
MNEKFSSQDNIESIEVSPELKKNVKNFLI